MKKWWTDNFYQFLLKFNSFCIELPKIFQCIQYSNFFATIIDINNGENQLSKMVGNLTIDHDQKNDAIKVLAMDFYSAVWQSNDEFEL